MKEIISLNLCYNTYWEDGDSHGLKVSVKLKLIGRIRMIGFNGGSNIDESRMAGRDAGLNHVLA